MSDKENRRRSNGLSALQGLLVRETFDGLSPEAGNLCMAIRCINCGSIEDCVVRANRLRPPAAKRAVPRGMVGMARAVFMKTEKSI